MYHVGKSGYFNLGFLLALAELKSRRIRFVNNEKERLLIGSFEIALVKVLKPFTPVIPTYSWEGDNPKQWDCNDSTSIFKNSQHRVVLTKDLMGTTSCVDFTSAQFGIASNYATSNAPYLHCEYSEMKAFDETKGYEFVLKILGNDIVQKEPKMKVLITIKNIVMQAGLFLNF